jgi:hypothetical protein
LAGVPINVVIPPRMVAKAESGIKGCRGCGRAISAATGMRSPAAILFMNESSAATISTEFASTNGGNENVRYHRQFSCHGRRLSINTKIEIERN